ncbi:MAG: hypothetical protein K6E81_05520 [Lachnospiraceae bacterium]|nr:hypothetical protein [Lachnospiraceae bacterium]
MDSKTVYEDYKYFMQDVSRIYIGCKYTLGEILDNQEILYKFRKVVADSILQRADRADTLETVLYYLEPDNFSLQVFRQMGGRVRISVLEDKKRLFGKKERVYVTKVIPVDALVRMRKEEKEKAGLFIQELQVSKLGLATC